MLSAILSAIVSVAVRVGSVSLAWVKEAAWKVGRALRAWGVWIAAHVTQRAVLLAASIAAFEVLTVSLTELAIIPLADGFVSHCLPTGSDGEGFFWMIWDTGLHGKELFRCAVYYLSQYTLVWRCFDTWLRAQMIALSVWRSAQKRAKALRDATIM